MVQIQIALSYSIIAQVAYVTKLVRDIGAILHYLPPYSPDFNLIEWCFSKAKAVIPSFEQETEAIQDIEVIALAAFATATEKDCDGWINDCGIYN